MIYVSNGQKHVVQLVPMAAALEQAFAPSAAGTRGPAGAAAAVASQAAQGVAKRVSQSIRRSKRMTGRFAAASESSMVLVAPRDQDSGSALTIATETVAVEGARQADLKWAAKEFGAVVIEEGDQGKLLLRVPGDGTTGIQRAFTLAERLVARGVAVAHPNFIRAISRVRPSALAAALWNHTIIDLPAAWKVTKGSKTITVAVLDEGVDTKHPALKAAVVAQRDFIGSNGNSAMPAGDDAHGTACAGIVLGRSKTAYGVAPRVKLIAARIAEGDGGDGWVFDDFSTADAIDWCWQEGADVLNNSWGGGPSVDVITRAFERARTLGRGGKGSVVVVSAGNHQGAVMYPATLPGVLAVGASNQWDERKTRNSQDGETWWGSCFGPELALLAPGVAIKTTDISGPRGYDPGDYTDTFNGTSSAAPHVAGVAALVLSVAPHLRASQVRQIITATADKLAGQTGWTAQLGHGRLNAAAAVAAAQVAPASPAVVAGARPVRRRVARRVAPRRAPLRKRAARKRAARS